MFYLIEISKQKDKETSKAIYSYEDRDMAIGTFHQKLGGAMRNDTFLNEMAMVIDDRGSVQAYNYWEREIEPEVVEEIPEEVQD